MFTKIGIGLAVLGVVSFGVYRRFVHPGDPKRGVTDQESHRSLSDDDVLPNSDVIATRAMTMDASPEQVWPALLQACSRRDSQDELNRFDHDTVPSPEEILPAAPQFAAEGTPSHEGG
jgi:hypothetical protein